MPRRNWVGRAACAVIIGVWCASTVSAAPVQWEETAGGNGHWYELVVETTNWADAEAAAESMSHLGAQGHLLTISGEAENTFVLNNLAVTMQYCIGGYQADGASEPDGGWQWITGEAWSYEPWAIGQPDNGASTAESKLTFCGPDLGENYPAGTWNDVSSEALLAGYIVEYPVPEPATMSLFALGTVGLIRRRKKA